MSMLELGLVIGLAAAVLLSLCRQVVQVAEQRTMSVQKSSDLSEHKAILGRQTCLSCAVATSTTGGR